MSQVTVSDVRDITKLTNEDLLGWIESHRISLCSTNPDRYATAILDDLVKLEIEAKNRNLDTGSAYYTMWRMNNKSTYVE